MKIQPYANFRTCAFAQAQAHAQLFIFMYFYCIYTRHCTNIIYYMEKPLLHQLLAMRNFHRRLSFTFQITLSSRLIPVQKLWLLLCSIISHDFRLLQRMFAAHNNWFVPTKRMNGKEERGEWERATEWVSEMCRKQNFNSIYWSNSFASICPKIKNEENISFYISVESICNVSLNQWVFNEVFLLLLLFFRTFFFSSYRNEGGADEKTIAKHWMNETRVYVWWNYVLYPVFTFISYRNRISSWKKKLFARSSNVNINSRKVSCSTRMKYTHFTGKKTTTTKLNQMNYHTHNVDLGILYGDSRCLIWESSDRKPSILHACIAILHAQNAVRIYHSWGYENIHGRTRTFF